MSLFRRSTKPAPAPSPTPAEIAAGLTTYAADLLAGDALAIDLAVDGEMPESPREWAAYPSWPLRLSRQDHFGGPSSDDLPDESTR